MSNDVVKVKARKQHDWHQDQRFVYIKLPMANTSIKKIEFFLSDVVLRVTSLEKKTTHVFDLFEAINYKSKENKNVYVNGVLEITLLKEKQGSWPSLLVDLPIQQLKERRKDSERRYEQTVHEIQEKKQKIRDEYDRLATQQLMRFEQAQKDKLEQKKKQQKQQALGNIYKDITADGRIKNKSIDWDEKERIANELLENEEKLDEEKRLQAKKISIKSKVQKHSNSMFTPEEIEASEVEAIKNNQKYQQIPIRKAQNVSLKFTQKIYPHVATRDTHYIDPPIPKKKALNNQDKSEALEQRNPLWLKDKGDLFVKNKDYQSAVNAYNKSINLDSKAIAVYLNRSYSHMKLFNFEQCIADCESVISLLQGMIGNNDIESTKTLIKCHLRKAICLAWKGQLEQSKNMFHEVIANFKDSLTQGDMEDIQRSIQTIKAREESNSIKFQADLQFRKGNYDLSADLYDESSNKHDNQYSHSNKALVLLKLNQPKNVIQECDKALSTINSLVAKPEKALSSYQSTKLLIKILHRKSTAQKILNKLSESLETVREALLLDEEDKECRQLQKQIESLINKENVTKMKAEAAELLKSLKVAEALEKYNDCLKIVDSTDVMEYLALLQNRCVCYMKLERWDDIVSTSIRSLNIINSQQSRIVSFDNTKVSKEKLLEFEVRILVRRANAYLNLNQIYNAKSDLQKALKISPENESIRKELEKVKQALNK